MATQWEFERERKAKNRRNLLLVVILGILALSGVTVGLLITVDFSPQQPAPIPNPTIMATLRPTIAPTVTPKPTLGPTPEPTAIPIEFRGGRSKVELVTTVTIQLRNEPGTVNARQAAKYLNGHIIEAGTIFSYNKAVGERTPERGFVIGQLPIKVKGEEVLIKDYGSGVCRLSVASATAADRMGLQSVARAPHEYTPYYFATNPDQHLSDATVMWGSLDNKFRNTKSYDILIKCSVGSDSVLKLTFSKITWLAPK